MTRLTRLTRLSLIPARGFAPDSLSPSSSALNRRLSRFGRCCWTGRSRLTPSADRRTRFAPGSRWAAPGIGGGLRRRSRGGRLRRERRRSLCRCRIKSRGSALSAPWDYLRFFLLVLLSRFTPGRSSKGTGITGITGATSRIEIHIYSTGITTERTQNRIVRRKIGRKPGGRFLR